MVAIKNLSDRNVAVQGKDGKVYHVLPGDVFPEWAEVNNPNVLGDQFEDDENREARYQAELAELHAKYHPEKKSKKSDDSDHGDDGEPGNGAPPRTGRGSGVDAWADYALDHNVEIEEGWSKDQIIAAVEAAGVPA